MSVFIQVDHVFDSVAEPVPIFQVGNTITVLHTHPGYMQRLNQNESQFQKCSLKEVCNCMETLKKFIKGQVADGNNEFTDHSFAILNSDDNMCNALMKKMLYFNWDASVQCV